MPFLLYILLANSALAQHTLVNYYRFNFGGILLGIWEFSFVAGILVALFVGGQYATRHPTQRRHPAFVWLLIFSCLGFLAGVFGAVLNQVPWKGALSSGREYAAWPICIYMGYRLMPSLRSAKTIVFTLILCALITSTILIWHFGENAEVAGIRNSYNSLRTVNYVSNYAGIVSVMLLYSVGNKKLKILWTPLALALAGYCLVGQWAPLNRSDWVAIIASFAALPLLMPKGKRLSMAFRMALGMPVLLASLWGGIAAASAIMHRDFGKKIADRLYTLLPTERYSRDDKAWDSRLPGIRLELDLWSRNPLLGQGFAAQEGEAEHTGVMNVSTNHNGWASVLAKTGIFGFIAAMMTFISLLLIGRRLVFDSTDKYVVLLGVAIAIGGLILLIQILATMIWTTRSAMLFGCLLGIAFRCYDLHTSAIAQTRDEYEYEHDPYALAAYPAHFESAEIG